MRRSNLSLGRVIGIYVAGFAAGIQGALYLGDVYDDGVADWRSGVIALVFVALGAALIRWSFTSRDAAS